MLAGVDVDLSDVGCGGGRGLIREAAGIEFPVWDPTTSYLIAGIEMDKGPGWGLRRDTRGIRSLGRMRDRDPVRHCDVL